MSSDLNQTGGIYNQHTDTEVNAIFKKKIKIEFFFFKKRAINQLCYNGGLSADPSDFSPQKYTYYARSRKLDESVTLNLLFF